MRRMAGNSHGVGLLEFPSCGSRWPRGRPSAARFFALQVGGSMRAPAQN